MSLCWALAPAPCPRPVQLDPQIADELDRAAQHRQKTVDDAKVNAALLPPLKAEMPPPSSRLIEPRFDLSVSNAPAAQVFMSIVSGTRYSMLVHPQVTGTISVNLKDVTVQEALDSIRELYGYEFKTDGTRIFIQPLSVQTRVFQVNYLIGQRQGRSDVRVTSGSIADAPATGAAGVAGVPAPGAAGTTPTTPGAPGAPAVAGGLSDSSRIQTQTRNDFWDELTKTLQTIVGNEPGRSVVVNAQAGLVVARAMPAELRGVEAYLKAIRLSVERQVMLEAKIVEVTLNDQYQAGVNWAAFPTSGIAGGLIGPQTVLSTTGAIATGPVTDPTLAANPSLRTIAAGTAAGTLIGGVPGGALLGLAFQTRNFAALLQFLESQGSVQVLSSPRIATLNNQKAVLKVGDDEFFLTSISGSTTTSTTTSTGAAVPSFPTITLRPFFSGVALDITPQINEGSNIILHIHPSVSVVKEDKRQIDLGTAFGGVVNLPLARSTVSETDSIVKVMDGNIVAIGGLMKVDVHDSRSGVPGAQDAPGIGGLFRSSQRTLVKKELVILIKPTVFQSDADSADEIRQVSDRIINMMPPSPAPGGQK